MAVTSPKSKDSKASKRFRKIFGPIIGDTILYECKCNNQCSTSALTVLDLLCSLILSQLSVLKPPALQTLYATILVLCKDVFPHLDLLHKQYHVHRYSQFQVLCNPFIILSVNRELSYYNLSCRLLLRSLSGQHSSWASLHNSRLALLLR